MTGDPDRTDSGGGPSGDARAAPRRDAREVPWITRVKLASREEAQIVNISTSGVLIECRAKWPQDAMVDIQIVNARTVVKTRGRVVRCEMAGIDRTSAATYRAALEFVDVFPLEAINTQK